MAFSNKKKSKVWKPADREKYYYIRNDGEVYQAFYEKNCSTDCGNYSLGNCFRTEEEAKFAVEKLKVIAELKRIEISKEAIYKANQESINAIKLELKLMESEMQREWSN